MLIIYFFPGIILLGIISSYTDIKSGKIKNVHLCYAFIYLFFVFSYLFLRDFVDLSFLMRSFANFFISLIIGIILWNYGFWTSGDAKIFATYSFLVPLTIYKNASIVFFPSLDMLINTFVPVIISYFLAWFFKPNLKSKKKEFFQILKPKNVFRTFVFLFSIMWISKMFVLKDPLFNMIFLLAALIILKRFFDRGLIYILFFVSILRLFFDGSVYSMRFLEDFVLFFLFWLVINYIINKKNFSGFVKKIKLKDLKEGMVPLSKKIYTEIKSEGLNKKELKKAQLSYRGSIEIKDTLPFAPFLFMGVLLTIMLNGNIVSFFFLF